MVGAVIMLVTVTALWVAFGVALLATPVTLDDLWTRVRDLPWIGQIVAWVVFLPWLLGMAAWRAAWPVALRVAAVTGLAVATVGLFWPRGR